MHAHHFAPYTAPCERGFAALQNLRLTVLEHLCIVWRQGGRSTVPPGFREKVRYADGQSRISSYKICFIR